MTEPATTTPNKSKPKWKLTVLVCCVVLLAVLAALFVPWEAMAKEKARRINCAGNLRSLGLVLRMYSSDNSECFPPELRGIISQGYLTTGKVFTCPSTETIACSDMQEFDESRHSDYVYLGWNQTEDGGDHDPRRTIIMHERPGNHEGFFNVCFVDGHVKGYRGSDVETIAEREGLFMPMRFTQQVLADKDADAPSDVPPDLRFVLQAGHVEEARKYTEPIPARHAKETEVCLKMETGPEEAKEENQRFTLRFINPIAAPITFMGFSPSYPVYWVQEWAGEKWRNVVLERQWLCGTGIHRCAISSGQSSIFAVQAKEYLFPIRVGVEYAYGESTQERQMVWSQRIESNSSREPFLEPFVFPAGKDPTSHSVEVPINQD